MGKSPFPIQFIQLGLESNKLNSFNWGLRAIWPRRAQEFNKLNKLHGEGPFPIQFVQLGLESNKLTKWKKLNTLNYFNWGLRTIWPRTAKELRKLNKLNREGPFPESNFQFVQLGLELNKLNKLN